MGLGRRIGMSVFEEIGGRWGMKLELFVSWNCRGCVHRIRESKDVWLCDETLFFSIDKCMIWRLDEVCTRYEQRG